MADVIGVDGTYRDPLWRVTVELSDLERRLLGSWWVRRLAYVMHAGASGLVTTQGYSRLEHSLGLLALVAHFRPEDAEGRIAALLHDVGHLPFSHTFEGVAGLDHHVLGIDRVRDLASILREHGLDPDDVMQAGRTLDGRTGELSLDHLDSFLRSGQAHGRTQELPAHTLERIDLHDGAVATDRDTAAYLADLIVDEAGWQSSPVNVVATGVLRYLASTLLLNMEDHERSAAATMVDREFWSLLLSHPETRAIAADFQKHPELWRVTDEPGTRKGTIVHEIRRRYLDVPIVDGRPSLCRS
ncbi:HD domain-containing protein [Leifsonia shinshuensis]|uniref:HD domain-containing protein n=1 Tax=Leifsonia shinshuensis TaxID=150026 RepID=UPI0016268649|nr:HD domain-containing protein [Leifsonia shinshuensis]